MLFPRGRGLSGCADGACRWSWLQPQAIPWSTDYARGIVGATGLISQKGGTPLPAPHPLRDRAPAGLENGGQRPAEPDSMHAISRSNHGRAWLGAHRAYNRAACTKDLFPVSSVPRKTLRACTADLISKFMNLSGVILVACAISDFGPKVFSFERSRQFPLAERPQEYYVGFHRPSPHKQVALLQYHCIPLMDSAPAWPIPFPFHLYLFGGNTDEDVMVIIGLPDFI